MSLIDFWKSSAGTLSAFASTGRSVKVIAVGPFVDVPVRRIWIFEVPRPVCSPRSVFEAPRMRAIMSNASRTCSWAGLRVVI